MELVLRAFRTSAVKSNEGPQAMNHVLIDLYFKTGRFGNCAFLISFDIYVD